MLKKYFIVCLIVFLLMFKNTSAQISFSISTSEISCKALAEVTVDSSSTNPPYTYLWSNGQTNKIATFQNNGTYSVTVTNALGETKSNNVTILITCRMAPENIFTPNDDGYNDTWFIQNYQKYANALVLVFNRLGQKVYEHKGLYEPWDGTDLYGVVQPDGSYYYIVYEDADKKENIIKGCVSILR